MFKLRKLVNAYHFDADNVGDQLCGPAQYFFPRQSTSVRIDKKPEPRHTYLLGGGQVFSQLKKHTESSGSLKPPKPVAWGVGLPLKGKRDKAVAKVAAHFSLFGTRNYGWKDELAFVPCASCMHTSLDDLPGPSRDVVLFLHRRKTPELKAPGGVPCMTNKARPAREVFEFIASGETVVTSSYHGVYWAQLIGRKVLCIPFNDKFRTFQFQPYFSTATEWRRDLVNAHALDSPLEEYRFINTEFARKVSDVLGVPLA